MNKHLANPRTHPRQVMLRLSDSDYQALEAIATAHERTMGSEVRYIVKQYLAHQTSQK